jgi:S1-C subfamily serine protease
MNDLPPDPDRGSEPPVWMPGDPPPPPAPPVPPAPPAGATPPPHPPPGPHPGLGWFDPPGAPAPPPLWPPDAPYSPAPRRRAFVLLAIVAILALVLGTTGGIVVRSNDDSGNGGFAFRPSAEDQRFDAFTDEFATPAPTDIDVEGIADRVSPAVVNLRVLLTSGYATAGSGLVISAAGHVLTNNHVINGAREVQVQFGTTGEEKEAEVLGYDMGDDVALLKLQDVSDLETIRTARSTTVSRNDSVVAIGNALGAFGKPSAVGGTVTALNQSITAGDGAEREVLPNMIRFSGAIRPGDSGGALVDARGRVVGMNTAADPGGADRFGLNAGTTGFAIPIETALGIADQIRRGDDSNGVHIGDRALLGVLLSERSEVGPFDDGGTGALVTGVDEDSAAADAGIEDGSTILAVAGRSIRSNDDLRHALDRFHPGDRVVVRWTDPDGDGRRATVTLRKGPPA